MVDGGLSHRRNLLLPEMKQYHHTAPDSFLLDSFSQVDSSHGLACGSRLLHFSKIMENYLVFLYYKYRNSSY